MGWMTVRRDYSHNPISRTRSNTPLHPSLTRTRSLQAGGVKVLQMKTYGAPWLSLQWSRRRLFYSLEDWIMLCLPALSRWGGRGWCPRHPRPRSQSRPLRPAPDSEWGPCSSPTAGTWRPRCPPALAPESRPETESSDQSAEQREHRVCLLKLKRERYGAPPNNKIWNLIWFILLAKSRHPSEDTKQSSWG